MPVELRVRLYEEVQALRKAGLSHTGIIDQLEAICGVRLSTSRISYWLRGMHTPLRKIHQFVPLPTRELAYVIGVVLGDGWLNLDGYNHRVGLSVKDLEFAEEFDCCVSKVLGCKQHIISRRKDSRWMVRVGSVLLYNFLNRPLDKLKNYVGHCRNCAGAFLKGFFDSEGSIHERNLFVYNTDVQLLKYVQHLLTEFFRIETTGPRVNTRADRELIKGMHYHKLDCYYVRVRARSLETFYSHIGFTIKRKMDGLEKAAHG